MVLLFLVTQTEYLKVTAECCCLEPLPDVMAGGHLPAVVRKPTRQCPQGWQEGGPVLCSFSSLGCHLGLVIFFKKMLRRG